MPAFDDGQKDTALPTSAVVETDAATWLALALGDLSWADAVAAGRVTASGERSDLTEHLPLIGRTP